MNERVINLAVEGMTCGNCVRRVEKAVYEVEGVVSANADLATRTVDIKVVDGDEIAKDLIQAIKNIGYHLPVDKVVLPISGMTCFNCVTQVDLALNNVPGYPSRSRIEQCSRCYQRKYQPNDGESRRVLRPRFGNNARL
jgi:copper ion binding protein